MRLIFKIFKQLNKKKLLIPSVYLKMFMFMIWKLTQIKTINSKFMHADMVVYNNLIEILKEIRTHLIKLNIQPVPIVLLK